MDRELRPAVHGHRAFMKTAPTKLGLALGVAAVLVACDSQPQPEPEPTTLPAVCTALSDSAARKAVGASASADVKRDRNDGTVSCRYLVKGAKQALNVSLVTTDEEPSAYLAGLRECEGGQVVDDLDATFCPGDPYRATGARITVLSGEQLVTVWHSGGYEMPDAKTKLAVAAKELAADPEAFKSG